MKLKAPFSFNSDSLRIARDGIALALLLVGGKVVGAAKEIAIAYRYGVSGTVDAYQFALTAINWIPGMLISALTVVLIPLFVRLKSEVPEERELFLRELSGAIILVGLLVSIALILSTPTILSMIGAQLSNDTYRLTVSVVRELAFSSILVLLFGLYANQLMAGGSYANTALEATPSLILLIFVLFSLGHEGAGPLVSGTWFGCLTQVGLTALVLKYSNILTGRELVPKVSFRSSYWFEMNKFLTITIIGQFALSFSSPLDQVYAARVGDNSIAILGYATRISSLVTSLGTVVVVRAMLPAFSSLEASGDLRQLHRTALHWSVLFFIGGSAMLAIFWPLSSLVVKLLFQRGAFSATETIAVSELLRILMIQVPFYFAGLVLVQLLASRRRYIPIAVIAIVTVMFKWLLNALLTPHFGLYGVVLATSGMYFLSMILLYSTIKYVNPEKSLIGRFKF